MNRKLLKGYVLVIISAIIFGTMPLMAKIIYKDGVNPVTLVFLRNVLAVPVLAVLSGKSIKIKKEAALSISIIGLVGCAITPMLLFESYKHIPSGTATVFHFIYPAVVIVGEFLFLKSKISKGNILSVVLCVVGLALFYNPQNNINFKGSFVARLSGVTYATYVILLSGFRHKEISGFVFSFYVSLISSVAMFLICFLTDSFSFPQSVFGWVLCLLFAMSLSVGAVVLFQKGTFLIGGGRAAVLLADGLRSEFTGFDEVGLLLHRLGPHGADGGHAPPGRRILDILHAVMAQQTAPERLMLIGAEEQHLLIA